MNEYIPTIKITVEIQENGIIRRDDTGRFIGRLINYSFNDLKDCNEAPKKEKEDA